MFKVKAGDWLVASLFSGVMVIGLTACGGGGGGAGSSAAAISTITGKVLAGPVAGAKVMVDMNDNRLIDAADFTCPLPTDSDGTFSCPAKDSKGVSTQGHVYLTQGGTDMYTGLPITNTMMAPPNASVVTPLTTLLVKLLPGGAITPAGVDAANLAVTTAFGLPNIPLASTDSTSGTPTGNQVAAAEAALQQLISQIIAATQMLGNPAASSTASAAVLQSLASAIAAQSSVLVSPGNLGILVSSSVSQAATQVTGSATSGNNLALLFTQTLVNSLQSTLASSGAAAIATLQTAAADSAIVQKAMQSLVAAMSGVVNAPTALTPQTASGVASAISNAIRNVVSGGQTLAAQNGMLFNAASAIGVTQAGLNNATAINALVMGDVSTLNSIQTASGLSVTAPLTTLNLALSASSIPPLALPTAQSLGISISGVGNNRSLQAVINGLDFAAASGTQVTVSQMNSLLYVKAMTTNGVAANAILWTPASMVTASNTGITVDIGALMTALTQSKAAFNNAPLARGNYVVSYALSINNVPVVTPTGLPIRVVNVTVPNFLGAASTKAVLASATGAGKLALPVNVR